MCQTLSVQFHVFLGVLKSTNVQQQQSPIVDLLHYANMYANTYLQFANMFYEIHCTWSLLNTRVEQLNKGVWFYCFNIIRSSEENSEESSSRDESYSHQ